MLLQSSLNKITTAAITAIVFFACQKPIEWPEEDSIPAPTPVTESKVNDNEMVVASVEGIVVNEKNIPVINATVKSGSQTTTTNRYGVFKFSNISLSKANGTVKVEYNGYFNAFRTFVSKAGRNHNVRIQLIPKKNSVSFSAASGGTISITGGGKLVMPSSAVTDASGIAYNGTVNVAMTWLDPTAPNLASILIGDLRGITTDGIERGLTTYGMLGVELTDAGGQLLKIATGKTAELTFPVPSSIGGNAPATIDLWHFDDATARWKQDGIATKTGNNYVANVSHFSFWNVDAKFPIVDLCMTLVHPTENSPLINAQVRIKRVVNNGYGYGRTDEFGRLCGKVPKDEALVLEVLSQCNEVIFSKNIGPFSSNSDLNTVAVDMPSVNSLTIKGTVTNCASANVTNGAAVVYIEGGNNYSVPVSNGTFSLTIARCATGAVNFSILGVDYTSLQQGDPVSGSGTTGIVNAGTVKACGTSASQFIEFLIDGTPQTYTTPPDSIMSSVYSSNRQVYIAKTNAGSTTDGSSFTYTDRTTIGTTPLISCFIRSGLNISQQIVTTSPVVNITAVGPPLTGFIEGNFTVQMNFSGTVKTVVCTFRVRR